MTRLTMLARANGAAIKEAATVSGATANIKTTGYAAWLNRYRSQMNSWRRNTQRPRLRPDQLSRQSLRLNTHWSRMAPMGIQLRSPQGAYDVSATA